MASTIQDSFTDHPVIVPNNPLDLESLQEVPDSHSWPLLDDYVSLDSSSGSESVSVPVIDLTDPDAVNLMGHASKTWGVFQITNHGIPLQLLDEVESQSLRLFSLPTQQKLKAARSPDGVPGYGVARISTFFSKFFWSEGFTILGSPLHHARQLWPQDYSKFCEVMEEYQKEMEVLADRLIWLMLSSLGITKEDVQWVGPNGKLNGDIGALQLNYYPACPDPNRAMGLAEHTDTNFITILYQNGSCVGLQVLKDKVGWVTVPPTRGALVINIGDLLHILSNGHFHCVLHRALASSSGHRLSIAYFSGPQANVQISPLLKLIDPINHPPLYRPVTWTEYLGIRAKHFQKALLSIRLSL